MHNGKKKYRNSQKIVDAVLPFLQQKNATFQQGGAGLLLDGSFIISGKFGLVLGNGSQRAAG